MISRAEIYTEILRTISKVFSGTSLALASFISITFVLALDVPENLVTVGGYNVAFTPALALWAISLAFSFLVIACLLLALLLLVETKNDSDDDN